MDPFRPIAVALLSAAFALAQAPPTPAKPKPDGAYQQAARLPARIMEFRAEPTTLQPGQSATLIWAAENPQSITISGIGDVTALGSRRLTPAATTIYTLTVRGPNGEQTRSVTVTVAGTTPVSAQAADTPQPTPRMPDGKPDLSGVYNSSSFNFGGRPVRGQNDPITAKLKPGAEQFRVVRGPEDPGLTSDCRPTGLPRAYFVPYQWQIVQGRDFVVVMYEYPHLFRIIPVTPGAAHPLDPDPTWMGNSVGRWEGDTLVVDTIGFNDKTELPGNFRHTEALHVVERFTRTSFADLDYVATIEDPNVFQEPWTISRGFPLRTDLTTISEFVCENNRDYTQFFEKK